MHFANGKTPRWTTGQDAAGETSDLSPGKRTLEAGLPEAAE
jgi:hypothetical protein